jgi:hypothetical protein
LSMSRSVRTAANGTFKCSSSMHRINKTVLQRRLANLRLHFLNAECSQTPLSWGQEHPDPPSSSCSFH